MSAIFDLAPTKRHHQATAALHAVLRPCRVVVTKELPICRKPTLQRVDPQPGPNGAPPSAWTMKSFEAGGLPIVPERIMFASSMAEVQGGKLKDRHAIIKTPSGWTEAGHVAFAPKRGIVTVGSLTFWDNDGEWESGTGAQGSCLPVGATMVSAEDVEAGRIAHALSLSLPRISVGSPVAPARNGQRDPLVTVPGGLFYGRRVRLGPLAPPAHNAPAALLLSCLRSYGAFVADLCGPGVAHVRWERDVPGYREASLWLSRVPVECWEAVS